MRKQRPLVANYSGSIEGQNIRKKESCFFVDFSHTRSVSIQDEFYKLMDIIK
jgi:hypothetical protein